MLALALLVSLSQVPPALPLLTVRDEDGAAFPLAKLAGTPVVLTMAYTACKTRCPMTLNAMKKVEAGFVAAGVPVQLVVITLDPHNDSPQKLKATKAVRDLGPQWHLLVASDEQTTQLLASLQLKAMRDDFHIDHETKVFVFDSQLALLKQYSGWKFDVDEPVQLASKSR
jgi:protein SCO1/2